MLKKFKIVLPYLCFLGLLTWGIYVTFVFIGVDGHLVVLLQNAKAQAIAQQTPSPFWRGIHALVPFIEFLLERLKPFTAYAVISVLLYAAYVFYTIFRSGRLYIHTQLSALHILLFGVGSLWLIFTTFFYTTSSPSLQPRLLIEPTKEVYANIGEEGLEALQNNFERMEKEGCLTQDLLRQGPGGAKVYTYNSFCAQKAFIGRVLSQLGMLLFFVLNFLVLGKFFLWLTRLRPSSFFLEFLFSLGLGVAGLITTLWVLAFFGVLQAPYAWSLLFAIPAIGCKYSWYWIRASYREKWNWKSSISICV